MKPGYRISLFFVILLILSGYSVRAQLAITEVMSSASTNLGPNLVTQNSDYWELTNFGTNRIDLTGYKFDDSDNNLVAADPTPFQGLSIDPGESIVFVQSDVNTNETSFRAWWGTNISANAKIAFYSGNGFSSGGDGIRLWGPNARDASDVIDSVDFSEAKRGFSFTYDPVTGDFASFSTNGVSGAFKALTTDDSGSPGRTTGPTPLTILEQPTNIVVNPGDTATFKVVVRGRPRGSLQWYFKDASIEGATGVTLQITNVQSAAAGAYQVKVNNGIQTVSSASAELVLQSQAQAPVLTTVPLDLYMTVGQSFTFHATASGVPQPTFQWQAGGVDIAGANTADLMLASVAEKNSGDYAVIARNALGSATNHFQVTVTQKPQLVITEVMSSSSTNVAGHGDWWELSNLGPFPVSLKGLRFDDNSETLGSAFTFTNNAVIAPGESVIFTEDMTPDAFRTWWGADNLPANLQVITYHGNGLSSGGDAINVWNAAASDDSDKIASVVFSTATAGVSFGSNPDTGAFGDLSVDGKFGALAAASGGDIGSPGYTKAGQHQPSLRFTEIARTGSGFRVTWTSQPGTTYVLQAKSQLADATWTTVTTIPAAAATVSYEDPSSGGSGQRFYRVTVQP